MGQACVHRATRTQAVGTQTDPIRRTPAHGPSARAAPRTTDSEVTLPRAPTADPMTASDGDLFIAQIDLQIRSKQEAVRKAEEDIARLALSKRRRLQYRWQAEQELLRRGERDLDTHSEADAPGGWTWVGPLDRSPEREDEGWWDDPSYAPSSQGNGS